MIKMDINKYSESSDEMLDMRKLKCKWCGRFIVIHKKEIIPQDVVCLNTEKKICHLR